MAKTISFSSTRTASDGLVRGDSGNDRLTFVNTNNLIVNGNADDDTITVSGTFTNSTVYGGRQKDTISVVGITSGMVRGDANEDDITVTGELSNAIINGNAGGDQITFSTAANAISNTTVYGGKGIDTIDLTNTKGVYVAAGADGDDINISASAPNTIYGGAGDDSVNYTVAVTTAARELYLDAEAGDDVIVITETAEDAASVASIHTVFGGAGDDDITATTGKELINGGAGNDTIAAAGGSDTVTGGTGDDKVTTAAGGGTGSKVSVTGGDGADNFELAVGNLTFEDTINGEGGADKITVTTAANFDMTASNSQAEKSFDNVSSIETLALKFNANAVDLLTVKLSSKAQTAGIATIDSSEVTDSDGNTVAIATVDATAFSSARSLNFIGSDSNTVRDSFVGGSGNDTLSTGDDTATGGEVLFGGGGVDTFVVEAASVDATISDLNTGETFTVSSSASGANITVKSDFVAGAGTINNKAYDDVVLTADDGVDMTMTLAQGNFGYSLIGGATAATITGSGFNDSLRGGAGNDSLSGGGGNDTIQALGGKDTLKGGGGNDTFVYVETSKDPGTSTIDGETGTNIIDVAGVTGAASFASATVSNIDTVTGVSLALGGTLNITGVGETTVIADTSGTNTVLTGLDDQTSTILDLSALTSTNWEAEAEANTGAVTEAGEWHMADSGVLTFWDTKLSTPATSSITLTAVLAAELTSSSDASVQTFTITAA